MFCPYIVNYTRIQTDYYIIENRQDSANYNYFQTKLGKGQHYDVDQ